MGLSLLLKMSPLRNKHPVLNRSPKVPGLNPQCEESNPVLKEVRRSFRVLMCTFTHPCPHTDIHTHITCLSAFVAQFLVTCFWCLDRHMFVVLLPSPCYVLTSLFVALGSEPYDVLCYRSRYMFVTFSRVFVVLRRYTKRHNKTRHDTTRHKTTCHATP